ncbi:MAG: carboxypeptidase-like regulatory domain-containing protein, partial [Flavobacteriales bacterium]
MIKIKHFHITLLFILFFFNGFCQESISLRGKVKWKKGEPVENAEVSLAYTPHTVHTDSTGNFSINDIKKGKYILYIFAHGSETIKREIELDSSMTIKFSLNKLKGQLEEVTVTSNKENNTGIKRMGSVKGMGIYDGKKSEVVSVEEMNANLATNNSRQIFSKVPGLNIWQSDESGIQMDIGARGLNPKRSANFNTRQNGYDMSADALGYPEAYYTPPSDAIKEIEVVKGAASLQYGPQFGGLVNFKLKDANTKKAFKLTTKQTYGSFGLFNSFNSVEGNLEKWSYYGFFHYKRGNGWRENSDFNKKTMYGKVTYSPNKKLKFTGEF